MLTVSQYCSAEQQLVAKLPESISFIDGTVLPLALSTAAASIFQKQNLALQLPAIDSKPNGQLVVIW
jgi:NADPH:quinone reductase-like Zn-dependent oxidoreductase